MHLTLNSYYIYVFLMSWKKQEKKGKKKKKMVDESNKITS